jgi:hypothetical protein
VVIAGQLPRFEQCHALAQFAKLVLRETTCAAGYDAPSPAQNETPKMGIAYRIGEIAKCPHQPQAHCDIGGGVVTNLFKRRVQQAIEIDPWHHEPQYVRRIVVKRSEQLDLDLWRDPILARNANERDIFRNEMTDPP